MRLLAEVVPTLAMGVEDLVPVVLTGATAVLLARRLGRPALFAAAALLVAGGAAKASWKIVLAATGTDVAVLAELLFPLLAAGFCIAAAGLWRPGPVRAGVLAWCASAVAAVAARGLWPFIALTVGASTAVTLWVARTAVDRGTRAGAALALGQLAASLGMARLAAVEQTTALQWVEQAANTAGAAALLAAAHLATRGTPTRSPSTQEVSVA